MIKLSHLKLIKSLSNNGNVSEAAEELFISQSALSHKIKKLENLLGEMIFVRHSSPLKLTPNGLKLLDLANDVLPKIEHTERQLFQIEGGRLNIAIECHSCFDWLLPTLEIFRKKQPKIDFDLSISFSFEPFEALKNYDIDMVITSEIVKTKLFYYFPIFNYQMMMIMSKNNVLADKKYLLPKDIKNQTLLTYPVDINRLDVFNYFLKPAKISPKTIRKVELNLMMMQLILNNQGIATMPEWALTNKQKETINLKPLTKNGLWRTLYLAVRIDDKDLEYISDFVKITKSICFKNLKNISKVK
ncbi:Transcriptional activator MetR [hydrothermal vent metagenome]|uniref:HTH-type transcriptional regulator MetR n=1 Tax=hydrothermal vent metagenome TaxID=652676 RepID=A0A1W1CB22_9ZZZZ